MKIKLDTSDKFFEVISLISLLSTILIVSFAIPKLPDTIPYHFDFNGEPNGYGSKYAMWAEVAVSGFLYMLTGILSMFPESFNYPSQKNDKEAQYKLGAKLMRSLRACILFSITIVTVVVVKSAQTGSAKGAFWLIGMVLVILIGNLTWFAIKWKQIN